MIPFGKWWAISSSSWLEFWSASSAAMFALLLLFFLDVDLDCYMMNIQIVVRLLIQLIIHFECCSSKASNNMYLCKVSLPHCTKITPDQRNNHQWNESEWNEKQKGGLRCPHKVQADKCCNYSKSICCNLKCIQNGVSIRNVYIHVIIKLYYNVEWNKLFWILSYQHLWAPNTACRAFPHEGRKNGNKRVTVLEQGCLQTQA